MSTLTKLVGYDTPTPVQEKVIPLFLEGNDIIAQAETGTGKTAAFALPILKKLDKKTKCTQALVLAPTRELAIQVTEAFNKYGKQFGHSAIAIYGGQSYTIQRQALKKQPKIIVATPGRLVDMIKQNYVKLNAIEFFVLDEADEMLKMGFLDDVNLIIEQLPKTKQMALFSATMPKKIRTMAKENLKDPETVIIKPEATESAQITQQIIETDRYSKLNSLIKLLAQQKKVGTIIFVRTKQESMELADKIISKGHAAAAINGDMNQASREKTIERLKQGRLDILIATDVAARGIDVTRVEHVINYDAPFDVDTYVHRIGRTGRGGRTGLATIFANKKDRNIIRDIERKFGTLTVIEAPSSDELNQNQLTELRQKVLNIAQNSKKLGMFLKWTEEFIAEETTSTEEKLAALAYYTMQDSIFYEQKEPSEQEKRKSGKQDAKKFGKQKRYEKPKKHKSFSDKKFEHKKKFKNSKFKDKAKA